jgi:hypothetical protein
MKKTIITGLAGLFLALIINVAASGQTSIANTNLPKDLTYHRRANLENEFEFKKISRSEANQKAVKNFTKSYKSSPDELWFNVDGGFVAEFTSGDMHYLVDYDKKGNWLRTIRSYSEAELAQDLRYIVKSTYFDYEINLVQEIERPGSPVNYIIQLLGKTELINLRISEEEMVVLQKFNRSK